MKYHNGWEENVIIVIIAMNSRYLCTLHHLQYSAHLASWSTALSFLWKKERERESNWITLTSKYWLVYILINQLRQLWESYLTEWITVIYHKPRNYVLNLTLLGMSVAATWVLMVATIHGKQQVLFTNHCRHTATGYSYSLPIDSYVPVVGVALCLGPTSLYWHD